MMQTYALKYIENILSDADGPFSVGDVTYSVNGAETTSYSQSQHMCTPCCDGIVSLSYEF